MKNNKTAASNLFPNNLGMYERFDELKTNDPFKKRRDDFYRNYNRSNWKRDKTSKKQDPNFGQFKAKIDAAINTFVGVITERKMFVRIIPKYAKASEIKSVSDKISSAFHRYWIKPWEDKFMNDVFSISDMVFFGKGIEHWPTPGCFYSENVPVENVFPDTNAGPNPKTWNYVFVVKDFTIADLYKELKKSQKEEENGEEDDLTFSSSYLKEILDKGNINTYAKDSNSYEESDKDKRGDYSSGNRDSIVQIVYAYVKDSNDDENPVSLYCFPAKIKNYKKDSNSTTGEDSSMRFLCKKHGYYKCISQAIHTKVFQITRSYWRFNSFAQQIYLSTMLYDKSTSMILRAAKRSMILYWKSADKKTQQKLMNQTDDEIQVVDEDTTYITTNQTTNITQMIEAVRSIMIETENSQSLSQAPGSQNVKGYAITAEEASIRNQKQSEAEALNLKVMISNDVSLGKELYRRAMQNDSDEFKKAHSAFVSEMKDLNVNPDYYDFDNVYFASAYFTGSSQQSRLANAQATLQALLVQPTTPGQIQAQRDVVASLVGQENVDDYIAERAEVDPVVVKVGSENEDLDNPYVNPSNVPVLPTDKHMQEIPIHISDYEVKLNTANKIIQAAMQQKDPISQSIMLGAAGDLIAAQDNKGGHIMGHIQAVSNNKVNMESLATLLDKFKQLQSMQDQMSAQVLGLKDQISKSLSQSSMNTEDLRHKQAVNQLTETHMNNMNDIALGKEIEKKDSAKEKATFNAQVDVQKKGTDLAFQEESAKIKLKEQENVKKIKSNQSGKTGQAS